MVRPRFHNLPLEQREGIVRAARDEFAEHGFNAASLNRIIDVAGISKGSMYYYFDGKDDLYVHVVRQELGRLFENSGPFPIPTPEAADAFWSTISDYYLRLMTALAASPSLAALARDWLVVSPTPELQQAQREMERDALPWFEQALAAGQRIGAVRKDLPASLLISVVFGMGQALDAWLMLQELDDETFRELVRKSVDMIQKALSP